MGQYNVTHDSLTLRPYNQALGALSEKLCADNGQAGDDRCLFETRTAFDCVLRNKVRKYGDVTDNLGACKHHISNMKQALGHEAVFDSQLDHINRMSQSFV